MNYNFNKEEKGFSVTTDIDVSESKYNVYSSYPTQCKALEDKVIVTLDNPDKTQFVISIDDDEIEVNGEEFEGNSEELCLLLATAVLFDDGGGDGTGSQSAEDIGELLKTYPGYDEEATQALIHINGVLQWTTWIIV